MIDLGQQFGIGGLPFSPSGGMEPPVQFVRVTSDASTTSTTSTTSSTTTTSTTTTSTTTTTPPPCRIRVYNGVLLNLAFPKTAGEQTLSSVEVLQTVIQFAVPWQSQLELNTICSIHRHNGQWWLLQTWGKCPQSLASTTTTTSTTSTTSSTTPAPINV